MFWLDIDLIMQIADILFHLNVEYVPRLMVYHVDTLIRRLPLLLSTYIRNTAHIPVYKQVSNIQLLIKSKSGEVEDKYKVWCGRALENNSGDGGGGDRRRPR